MTKYIAPTTGATYCDDCAPESNEICRGEKLETASKDRLAELAYDRGVSTIKCSDTYCEKVLWQDEATRNIHRVEALPLEATLIRSTDGAGGDQHLQMVLAQMPDGEMVAWLHNMECGGYHAGVYGPHAEQSYDARAERIRGGA